MLAQEIDCQDIDSGPTLPAMDSPCAPRGLDALNERRRVARTAARHSANKLPYGHLTRKREAEAHRRLQAHFCLRSLGGPRFRSLLRLAADRKFRVVGKRSLWQVKLDRVSRMASKMSTAFMAESPGADQATMTQAIENVMTHGPCNDTWIRRHERRAGTYGLAVAVGRVAAIHFDVAACPTDVASAQLGSLDACTADASWGHNRLSGKTPEEIATIPAFFKRKLAEAQTREQRLIEDRDDLARELAEERRHRQRLSEDMDDLSRELAEERRHRAGLAEFFRGWQQGAATQVVPQDMPVHLVQWLDPDLVPPFRRAPRVP